MKKIFIVLTTLMISCTYGVSQETFNKIHLKYPGARFMDVVEKQDSSFLMTGIVNDSLLVCNVSKNGTVNWHNTVGDIQSVRYGNAIFPLHEENGYIIVGERFDTETRHDIYVLSINDSGDTLWTKTYGGLESDGVYGVCSNYEDGFMVCGYTNSFGGSLPQLYLLNFNSLGDTIWTKVIDSDQWLTGMDIINTQDSGYLVTGSCGAESDRDVLLMKLDQNGDSVWLKSYGGLQYDVANASVQLSNGTYIVSGTTSVNGDGDTDFYILSVDLIGDTIWTKRIEGFNDDRTLDLTRISDSCVVITGVTGDYPLTSVRVVKLDMMGNTRWIRDFKGFESKTPQSIIQTTDSSLLVVGYTYIGDIWYPLSLKVNKAGELLLDTSNDTIVISENIPADTIIGRVKYLYQGDTLHYLNNGYMILYSDCESAFSIDIDSGSIAVLDSSQIDYEIRNSIYMLVEVSDGENSDIAHIFIEITDVDEFYSGINNVEKQRILKIYPNPSSGLLNVERKVVTTPEVIEIINLKGQVVWRKTVSENSKVSTINISAIEPGVYLLKLITENGECSKMKFIIE